MPTIINDLLQGKFRQAGHDSARFLLNSTLGLGGLFDPASAAGLERQRRRPRSDLGQVGREAGALSHAARPRSLYGSRRVLARGRHATSSLSGTSRTTARATSSASVDLLDQRASLLGARRPAGTQLRPLRVHTQRLAAAPRVPGQGRQRRRPVTRARRRIQGRSGRPAPEH